MALYNEPKPELIEDGQQPNIMDYDNEYWRTNTNLSKDQGRAPSFEKVVDPRLPGLFSFEYGGQFGEVAIPKGRIVAVAADKQFKDFNTGKYYPAITLANGGIDVKEDQAEHWGEEDEYVREANKPVGVSTLNTYQDHQNSFKGNRPGFTTRNTIEVPLFNKKSDAEKMEWGSAYGTLKAGDKVMSDENGRFVKWKEGKLRKEKHEDIDVTDNEAEIQLDVACYPAEDHEDEVTIYYEDGDGNIVEEDEASLTVTPQTGEVTITNVDELEFEDGDDIHVMYRSILSNAEQMVGQVLTVHQNMIPAGWMKWVQPEEGEFMDFADRYTEPTGLTPHLVDDAPVYDPTYGRHEKYRPTSIPGILDGMNYTKLYADPENNTEVDDDEFNEDVDEGPQHAGRATVSEDWEEGDKLRVRMVESNLPVEKLRGLQLVTDDGDIIEHLEGESEVEEAISRKDIDEKYNVSGLIEFELGAASGDEILNTMDGTNDPEVGDQVHFMLEFEATHQMPGMPTHMDWNGCVGSVDILLQL